MANRGNILGDAGNTLFPRANPTTENMRKNEKHHCFDPNDVAWTKLEPSGLGKIVYFKNGQTKVFKLGTPEYYAAGNK